MWLVIKCPPFMHKASNLIPDIVLTRPSTIPTSAGVKGIVAKCEALPPENKTATTTKDRAGKICAGRIVDGSRKETSALSSLLWGRKCPEKKEFCVCGRSKLEGLVNI